LILSEKQYFAWDTAFQSTKRQDMLEFFRGNGSLGSLVTPMPGDTFVDEWFALRAVEYRFFSHSVSTSIRISERIIEKKLRPTQRNHRRCKHFYNFLLPQG